MSLEPKTNLTSDRSILLPILLGIFSLCGILLVFVIGRMSSARNALPAADTATPFKYQLIGTEPGISTAELVTEEPGSPENSPDNNNGPSVPLGLVVTAQQGSSSGSGSSSSNNPTNTKTSSSAIPTVIGNATNPIIILSTSARPTTTPLPILVYTSRPTSGPIPTISVTPSRTKSASITSTATQIPFTPGTYDDSHPLFAYNGWSSVTDPNAYQNTLHVSNTQGSTVAFKFTGQQIHIKFQWNASFGAIRIDIGGKSFDLDENNPDGVNEWVSTLLAQGTYTVTITHASGGSVNIDSIVIPDFKTPTPTATPTSTPTSQ
jgi:hypothetical protein